MRNTRVWLRRVLLLLVPLALAGVACKVRQLREPVEVRINSKSITAKMLLARLSKEVREHRYARSIKVESWFKSTVDRDVDVITGQTLVYNRLRKTLDYGELTDGYGWGFNKVNDADIHFLAKSDVGKSYLDLPDKTQDNLLKRGCVIAEHSLR